MRRSTVQTIVAKVVRTFPTMGGGAKARGNPITEAEKYEPPQFVTGVDVEEVVRVVLKKARAIERRKRRARQGKSNSKHAVC